jgi:hypothetical protein
MGNKHANLLETPNRVHGSQTHANNSHTGNDPAHPDMRTEFGHEQIGRQIE